MATTREIGSEQHESAADAAVTDARAETADAAHAAAALEAVEKAPTTAVLPAPETREHDVRRRRPPALSFLRRFDTLRRCLRIVTLIALDALGVYAALLVALAAKAAVQGDWNLDVSADQAYDYWTFAFLITALLFARSGLYANRASRPGLRGPPQPDFQAAKTIGLAGIEAGGVGASHQRNVRRRRIAPITA